MPLLTILSLILLRVEVFIDRCADLIAPATHSVRRARSSRPLAVLAAMAIIAATQGLLGSPDVAVAGLLLVTFQAVWVYRGHRYAQPHPKLWPGWMISLSLAVMPFLYLPLIVSALHRSEYRLAFVTALAFPFWLGLVTVHAAIARHSAAHRTSRLAT